MKWQGRRQSSNIDDRRGRSTVRRGGAVGGVGAVVLLVITFLVGGPEAALQNIGILTQGQVVEQEYQETEQDRQLREFAAVVLADTEEVWHSVFEDKLNRTYREPTMVIYSGQTEAGACGLADAAVGPFYCPADQQVYLDLSFYNDMNQKFGATGDFAFAYVIAHEVGHHVQTLLGVTEQLNTIRSQVSQSEYNKYSVAFELQADYLAGVYARYAAEAGLTEDGDLEEALTAAHAVGDDNIQKQSQGYVVPDSFTHGSSQQRMEWFKKGYQNGDLSEWDTFKALIE